MIGIPTLVIGQHFLELLDQLHLKDLDVNFLTSDPDAILSILFVYDKLSIENLDVINDYVILDPCSFPFNKSFDVIFVCLPFCSEDFELQALQNIYHISGKQSLLVFSYPLGIEFNEEVEDTLQGGMAGLRLPNCPCQQTSTRFLKIPSLVVEKILSWGVATLGVEDDITFLPESDEYEILIQTNKLPSLPRCFFDEPLRLIAEPKKPIERNSTQKKNKKRKIVKESTKKLRERGVKVFQRSEMARERYPSYFDPVLIFPQLSSLSDQFEGILEEVRQVVDWVPWPENHSNDGGYQNWEIFPFLFTFPGNDPSKTVIVNSTCQKCPLLSSLLISLRPNIRTALLSRLGPDSVISAHKGWADLANYVIRCHLGLMVPGKEDCGLWVEGEVSHHENGVWRAFDDSLNHRAFNFTDQERVILLVDMERPSHLNLGTAEGGHTNELDKLISAFLEGMEISMADDNEEEKT